MYLTRFEINTRRRTSRSLLGSAHRMHAAILKSFPREVDAGRVLWRLDPGPDARQDLLIMSASQPDLTALVEDCGWPTAEVGWQTRDYRGFLDGLAEGQRWQFRVVVNPVKSVATAGGRGKPVPLTRDQQQDWFVSRAFSHGFTVSEPQTVATSVRRDTLRFTKEAGTREVTLGVAQFEGVLRVCDADRLRRSMVEGIGRAKAYGCGLLTLRRP